MSDNTKENVEQSIKEAMEFFSTHWAVSVDARLAACEAYAKAVTMNSRIAYTTFHAMPRFKHWTQRQWKFYYYIGRKRIDPLYMDFKTISIPLMFASRQVPLTVQRSIFRTGLDVVNLRGEVVTVPLISLQVQQVEQVFDENGKKRTVEQQKEWIKKHQRPNFEVIDDSLVIHHSCIITRDETIAIMCDQLHITPSDIIEYRKNKK